MALTDPNDLLPVVDQEDREVARASRAEVHARGLLHRAAHVIVLDDQGRIYLQKRSAQKDTHPGKWTTSASGHLDPGESYDRAARRELAEELGLDLEIAFLGKLAASAATENEFTAVYLARTTREPRPAPDEIVELRAFTSAEARALAADPARAVPGLKLVLGLWDGE